MATTQRRAPRAALLAILLLALGLAWGVAGAAPAAQGAPTPTADTSPTAAPSATSEPSSTPTGAPSATAASPSATAAPSATATAPSATPTAASSATAASPSATATLSTTATAPVAAPAQAVRLEISKTLVGSDVVKVGQYLTFTIRITNTGTSAVTTLPLVDEFETTILQPALDRFTPPPTSSAPGVLRWADLTATFGDLAPGQSVEVTTIFRAIRIDDEVINRARVEAAIGVGGGGGAPVEGRDGGTVEGGSVTVAKALVPGFIDLADPVVSFAMTLRNDGFADIVRAPVVDTYRADLLSFISASVPPDFHDPATGELRWDDLLAGLGVPRLRPGETVAFTTTYRLLAPVDDLLVNSFDAVNAEDEFGNQVASPRRAEVRIRITGVGADATPTAEPTPEEERRPRATATAEAPTVTPAAPTAETGTPSAEAATPTMAAGTPAAETGTPAAEVATPTVAEGTPAAETATAAPAGGAPASLPATGAPRPPTAPWLIALVALAAGLALRGAARRGR